MKKLLMVSLMLLFGVGNAIGQDITTRLLTLTAPAPPTVKQVSTTIVGNQGNATYYYWVVAKYASGNANPSPAAIVITAPNVLGVSNYVRVNWDAVPGATGYDVLRTTTASVPNGNCACAVVTATASTTVNDQGGALGAYTVSSQGAVSSGCSLDNLSSATPVVTCAPYGWTPGGAAGGALTGTYPNPLIANVTTPGVVAFVSATPGVLTQDNLLAWNASTDILSVGPVQIKGVPGSNSTIIGALAGAVNAAIQNTFIGAGSGQATTTGQENTAIGYGTLQANLIGTNNVAVGNLALQNTLGDSNVGVGKDALVANTTGSSNVALGNAALKTNTIATGNTAIGASALQLNVTGTKLVALGFEAGRAMTGNRIVAIGYQAAKATTGASNVAVGTEALLLNTTSLYNTAIGDSALAVNLGGEENTGLGASALGTVTSGDRNTGIGSTAGTDLTTGSDNTLLGRGALAGAASASYRTVVGAGAAGTIDNSITLGRAADAVIIPGKFITATATPASASATGSAGQWAWDADYIYIAVGTDTWKRVAIAAWP